MINPKKIIIHCLYFILYCVTWVLITNDLVVTTSTDIEDIYIEGFYLYPSNASLLIFIFGLTFFLMLLIANIFIFKYSYSITLGIGLLAYLPILANFFIALYLNYVFSGIINLNLYLYMWIFILLSFVNLLVSTSLNIITNKDIAKIKKTVLNLGTRFTRLEIRDISEKSGLNIKKVEEITVRMIENDEIYATYKKKTKIIQFNQDTNLDKIDLLLQIYDNWEKNSIEKKK